MDNIIETAKILEAALKNQYDADVAANENTRRLADERIAYNNERAGTYYSGIPTWQRLQNATNAATDLTKIDNSYLNNRIKLWNSVQNTVDQINAYNDAAKQLGASAVNLEALPTPQNLPQTAPIYLNGKWYTYVNGQLKEVQNGQ